MSTRTHWETRRIVHAIGARVIPPLVAVLVALLAAPAKAGEDPAAEAERLVAELSAEDWKRRERARDRLVELGAPAVPALQRLLAETEDPEARTRAQDAIQRIEAADPASPTLVSLHLVGVSPQAAFAELGRQAGVELGVWPPWIFKTVKRQPIDVHVDREPFWSAMRVVCERADGVSVDRAGDLEQIVLTGRGGWGARPACVSGPFLVTVNTVNRAYWADYAEGEQVGRRLGVSLVAWSDPKLRVLRYVPTARVEQAVDDQGHSLAPAASPAVEWKPSDAGRNFKWKLDAALTEPDRDGPGSGRRIAVLKGSSRFLVAARSASVTVHDPMGADVEPRDLGAVRVTVTEMAREAGGNVDVAGNAGGPRDVYAARLRLERGTLGAREWKLLDDFQTLRSCLRLLDGDGRALVSTSGMHRAARDQIDFEIRFTRHSDHGPPRGEPAKLVIEIPTRVVELKADFEFKDLALP